MIKFFKNSNMKFLFLLNFLIFSCGYARNQFNFATPYKTFERYGDCLEEEYSGGVRAFRCIRYKGKPVNTLKASLFLFCIAPYKNRENKDSYDYKFVAISDRESALSILHARWSVNDFKADINKLKGTVSWGGVKSESDTSFVIRKLKSPLGSFSHSYEETRNENKKFKIEDAQIGDQKFSGEYWSKALNNLEKLPPKKGFCKEISKQEHVKYRNFYPILIK